MEEQRHSVALRISLLLSLKHHIHKNGTRKKWREERTKKKNNASGHHLQEAITASSYVLLPLRYIKPLKTLINKAIRSC